jgi:assimilatory nitrate reductase catalytic subunit
MVAGGIRDCIAEHGPDSVAFNVSGQLLTEDYYAANKLMKGFIGSGNIDTNSRLCMASAVAAHVHAFGEDIVPCSYDDLDAADLILLVGSNTAWCHPVIWQRIQQARARRGTKLVVIDPRRTETAEQADLHVPIAPDGDVALFNALLAELDRRGIFDASGLEVPEDFWSKLPMRAWT